MSLQNVGAPLSTRAVLEAQINILKVLVAQMGTTSPSPLAPSSGDTFQSSSNMFAPPSNLAASVPNAAGNPFAASPQAPVGDEVAEADPSRLTIAVIDNFGTDEDGFSHGETVNDIVQSGGGDASLAGSIDTLQMDASRGNNGSGIDTQSVSDHLDELIQRVQNGEDLDAVNLSLGTDNPDSLDSETTQGIRDKVQQLAELGIPVIFAAGNEGEGTSNQLAPEQFAFTVEAFRDGQREDYSGDGNTQSELPPDFELDGTSFAAPNLVTLIASMDNQGFSTAQTRERFLTPA